MKLYIISLGCDKNRVDAEKMLSAMLRHDSSISITEDISEAEIAIVNTCSFIGSAKEESIETILDIASYKEEGRLKKLIVCGCLVDRYREEIRKTLPEVDEIFGVRDYVDRLDKQIERISLGEEGYLRYLKIAEGCDKCCSYCAIPGIRGRYRSVPMEQLIEEASRLANEGAKELILVAQESTLYGTDLYGRKTLGLLVDRLSLISDIEWIRILYCYPEEIDDSLLDVMEGNPKVCHYLDLPIQHASDKILSLMGRKTNSKSLYHVLDMIRNKIPDIALRTTLITGFPGEGEKEFSELLSFVDEARFDRLGVFPYSREEGTRAFKMQPQISEKIKLQRLDKIMRAQQVIAFQKAKEQVGRRLDVIIESYDPERGLYEGRSYMDAPEIDAAVFVYENGDGFQNRMAGDIISVDIEGSDGYDLIGVPVSENN